MHTSHSKLFNLPEIQFLSLCRQKLTLNAIFLIEMIKNGIGIDREEYLSIIQLLQRKGYLNNKMEITEYGDKLYSDLFLEKPVETVKKRATEKSEAFDKFWEIFPSTDYFEINGRVFKGTQKKNLSKSECQKIFNVLCNSQFTGEQILQATKKHIEMAKEISYKKGSNQLSYIPNSLRYLTEKRFEPFVGDKIKKEDGDLTVEL